MARSPPPFRRAGLRSTSSSLRRQRWNFPSAVSLMRLQFPQYGSLTGEMNPTTPATGEPSLNRKFRDSSDGDVGGISSSGPSSVSIRFFVSGLGTY